MKRYVLGLAVMALLLAPAAQAQFRAADMVVVPVAASLTGLNGSDWHTDVHILNVDQDSGDDGVDVEIVFLQSGNFSNSAWFDDIANHLGGDAADGFGHVDAKLSGIKSGHSVTIEDIVANNWGAGIKGALLVFAYQHGTLTTTDPPGGVPRKVIVTSRTYTRSTGEDQVVSTYGQGIPGIPWYDYIDMSKDAQGFNQVTFTGIDQSTDFRTALGFVNVSDRLTSLTLKAVLTAADGTELKTVGVTLYPLSHNQFDNAVRTVFGLNETDYPEVKDASITVSVVSASSRADTPTPALMAYVSKVDNHTNDPTYIEQAFKVELPWDCVFNGACTTAQSLAIGRRFQRARPLAPPAW